MDRELERIRDEDIETLYPQPTTAVGDDADAEDADADEADSDQEDAVDAF